MICDKSMTDIYHIYIVAIFSLSAIFSSVDSKLFDKNAQLCSLISSVYVSEDHEERIKCGKDLLDYICNPENVKVNFATKIAYNHMIY